jgi:hypothetical protein
MQVIFVKDVDTRKIFFLQRIQLEAEEVVLSVEKEIVFL